MVKFKSVFQKSSLVSAVISFLLALTSGVLLYIRLQTIGIDDPISASYLASSFFFCCVGIVLTVIGTADIPSFKIDDPEVK